ncbi:hypothetical protein [Geofilum rubicundum]|nr:hypothetical protein [Geofilum rubicundum]
MIALVLCLSVLTNCSNKPPGIDRKALVARHTIIHQSKDALSPLTVGNGTFAFTADITGMQSFPDHYEQGIPLGTLSDWGWNSFPNQGDYTFDDVTRRYWTGQDSVPYLYQYEGEGSQRQQSATKWLRENPHRLHLGLVGLEIQLLDGNVVALDALEDVHQELDLWTGEMKSSFSVEGVPVEVTTVAHQEKDAVAFRIASSLLEEGRLRMRLRFPYGHPDKFSSGYDLGQPDRHSTTLIPLDAQSCRFQRALDDITYYTSLQWSGTASIETSALHDYYLVPTGEDEIELAVLFSQAEADDLLPDFSAVQSSSREQWPRFWESGAAVDFSECTDPIAFELERRVVLSQYLTRLQCTGPYPPQETGLTMNSWHGKFHLEMHWWHALHFILWNRTDLIEEQLDYYHTIFDKARQTAQWQGYDGVRWPKMIAPDGAESPSTIGTFLIWQQPHIIYFSELLWQNDYQRDRLAEKYQDLVFATADFMASYARWDSTDQRYVLGPPLIPAQERFAPETTENAAFELAYWDFGLRTAQKWRERAGLAPDEKWQQVIDHLSPLPVKNDLYLFTEDATDSYINRDYLSDHPMVLGMMGFLPPSAYVNFEFLESSYDVIRSVWQWETIWGWDVPLAAMTATFLNRPHEAVDILLMDTPKNTYLVNGHNYQHAELPLYLPGNGGILSAVSLMCTYKNSEGNNGFPQNGHWKVQYENMNNWVSY